MGKVGFFRKAWNWITKNPKKAIGTGGVTAIGIGSTIGSGLQAAASAAIAAVEFIFDFLRTMLSIAPKPVKLLFFLIGGMAALGLLVQWFLASTIVCANNDVYESDSIISAAFAKLKSNDVVDSIHGPFLRNGEYVYEIVAENEEINIHTKLYSDFIVRGAEINMSGSLRDDIYIFLPISTVSKSTDVQRTESSLTDKTIAVVEWIPFIGDAVSLVDTDLDEFFICKSAFEDEPLELEEGVFNPPGACYAKAESRFIQGCSFIASYSYPIYSENNDYGMDVYVALEYVDGASTSFLGDLWNTVFVSERESFTGGLNECVESTADESVHLEIRDPLYLNTDNLIQEQSGNVQGRYALLLDYVLSQSVSQDTRGSYVEKSRSFGLAPTEVSYNKCRGPGVCEPVTFACSEDKESVKVRVLGIDLFDTKIIWFLFILFGGFYVLKFMRVF